MNEVTSLITTIYVTTNEDDTIVITTQDDSVQQAGIQFEDEGLALGAKGTVNELDFVGSGVTATRSGDKITVSITSGGGGTVGPGTTNEIAYFNASTTIASLTTATYPSLTELSYVKGVTSSIQTQINNINPASRLFLYYNFY